MSEFAKLYGSGEDQLLVLLEADAEGMGPEIKIYFKPKDLGVCHWKIGYKDDDDGWRKAEQAFAKVNEKSAREATHAMRKKMGLL